MSVLPPVAFLPGTPDPEVTPAERDQISACRGVDPGPTLMRRLTRFEYDNTVRDVLGDETRPGNDFPAEEKRHGFENNAEALTVSPLLTEHYLMAAERVAARYLDRNDNSALAKAYGCDLSSLSSQSSGEGEDSCARAFIAGPSGLGLRIFRRPLAADEVEDLYRVYVDGKKLGAGSADVERGFRAGLELVLVTMLQSTRFLYRTEKGLPAENGQAVVRLDAWDTASRLSYLLWSSAPDDELLRAAAADQLRTRDEIAAQVQRMLKHRRARAMVARFHEQWLDLGIIDEAEKNTATFPKFNKGIARLMREETERFLAHVVWEGDGTLQAMLTAPYTFVDSTLAAFYGMAPLDLPKGKEGHPKNVFMKVNLDGKTRGGFLTQGTFMAALAHPNQTSPVRRGFWVRERLMCETLPDPPPDLMIELPDLDPRLTTRERFTDHALGFGCSGCHDKMDPIGLGLENFDGAGIFREMENGQPVDASGEVEGVADGEFVGGLGLARTLSQSPQVTDCLVRQWFAYAYGREILDCDACAVEFIKNRFAAGGGKLMDLVVALTATDTFLYRRVPGVVEGKK